MFFDTHIHSCMSPDGRMAPEEFIGQAEKMGLGVIFTEHMDFAVPDGKLFGGPPGINHKYLRWYKDFCTDIGMYKKTIDKNRSGSALFGLEITLGTEFANKNREFVNDNDLDYIIGSIHFTDGWELSCGIYYDQPYEDHYRRFLEYSAEMAAHPLNDFFDSFGHFTYVTRYSPLPDREVLYRQYADEFDSLFKTLIDRGKSLEINTNSNGFNNPATQNCVQLLKRYRELGGRYVTVGSDAHRPYNIAKNFVEARRLCRELELTPVYYMKRKMNVIPE